MAVYTKLDEDQLARLIAAYDLGTVISHKGIAEGVSNTNFLIGTCDDAGHQRNFILTIYESRTEVSELPFFLGLLDHLADRHCPVPRTVHDRAGRSLQTVRGKPAALIEFLPGLSLSHPTAAQVRAVGAALAQVHLASAAFTGHRANSLGHHHWRALADRCGAAGLASIDPALAQLVAQELDALDRDWPTGLPTGMIHADLFPDNVLMLGNEVSGLIDFYFACTDILAYDLAVTHAAWCFDESGARCDPELSAALIAGYQSLRALSIAEKSAMPVLARGAAMRFLLTRAYDWLNRPAEALVTNKDPMAFARRMAFYADHDNAGIFG